MTLATSVHRGLANVLVLPAVWAPLVVAVLAVLRASST